MNDDPIEISTTTVVLKNIINLHKFPKHREHSEASNICTKKGQNKIFRRTQNINCNIKEKDELRKNKIVQSLKLTLFLFW